jgi:polyphosphate glucokinase
MGWRRPWTERPKAHGARLEMAELRLGIDIGGSGIKGAPVDLDRGDLSVERIRIETPEPSTPDAIMAIVAEIVAAFPDVPGAIGAALPSVVRNGVAETAANIDPAWVGTDVAARFSAALERPVSVINDADAAGLAEMRYGAGRGRAGTVLVCTLGTGIGSALFLDGRLVPNTEFGHIEVRGKDGEKRAAASVRSERKLSWVDWAERLDEYLRRLEALIWPDLIILGGGVSRRHDRFIPLLTTRSPVVPAELQNAAGIVGAALACDRPPTPAAGTEAPPSP